MLAEGLLLADPIFADSIDHIDDAGHRYPHADRPVPPGWRRVEAGGWVYLQPADAELPEHGWKIHASATAATAADVVATVWEYCLRHGIAFKFLPSQIVFQLVNGKQAARSGSGKLVTIYPADEAGLERILTELSVPLKGVRGPYILSDLRWADGPLYLRYGGFAVKYCFSPDGEYVPALRAPDGQLVPDPRGTGFQPPRWAPVPDFVSARMRELAAASGGDFPYRVEKALHFSNGGGVYRAVEAATGRAVVLREARPHAGLDDNRSDAVTRLDREQAMLERLADLDCVPALIARTRHWEHHFLVEELVEGRNLWDEINLRHPLHHGSPDPVEIAEYTDWALQLLDRVEQAVARLHGRGVVFADLQPGNVMVRPDGGVCLVDFETAFELAAGGAPALGTPGFAASWARDGLAIDRYGLACLRLAVFAPLTPLLRFGAPQAERLIRGVERRFPLPAGYGQRLRAGLARPASAPTPPGIDWPADSPADPGWPPLTDSTGWDRVLDSMRDAIVRAATPERSDRLFPGDPRQFAEQGAGLAFGAAGVLYALHATGRGDYPGHADHLDWLAAAAERTRWPRPGLYDGLAGTAYALAELGRPEAARAVLDRLRGFDLRGCPLGLFSGLTGIALTLLHFGDTAGAARIGDRIAGALAEEAIPGADQVGLAHGWSGPAVLLTRLAAVTGEERYLDLAAAALAREVGRCRVERGRQLQVRDGEGWNSTLAAGTAGLGVALHEYLRHRQDPHYAGVLARIHGSLAVELLPGPGLLDGHAGLLAALTHLGGPPAARAVQLRALSVHAIPYRGGLAFPLPGLLRLSTDLATGTAGVLLATHAAVTGSRPVLPLLDTRP